MTTTGILIALFGALLLLALAKSHRALMRALSRPLPALAKPSTYPSVTVIRPIRGLDVGAKENLEALLDLAYPGEWELFCVLDSEADPAYPFVRSLIDGRGNHRASRVEVLIAGTPPPGRTGKLNAMLLGTQHARGEILAFNDSDTRPGPDLLRGLVDALLSNPRAGSAFAPIVATAAAPGAGDVGYALRVNAWYGPAVALVAGAEGELPFIMGQFMVFKREALEAIGGIGCAEGQLVDDMYIGKRVAQAGFFNVMIKERLPVFIGGMGMLQFLITFRRWILFSHGGLPRDFTRFNWARGLLGWGAWLGLTAALLMGDAAAAILPALAIAAFAASQLRLQKHFGGPSVPLRYLWIAPLMPIIGAGVALSTRISRRVNWRGRSYILERGARLGSGSEATGS